MFHKTGSNTYIHNPDTNNAREHYHGSAIPGGTFSGGRSMEAKYYLFEVLNI